MRAAYIRPSQLTAVIFEIIIENMTPILGVGMSHTGQHLNSARDKQGALSKKSPIIGLHLTRLHLSAAGFG